MIRTSLVSLLILLLAGCSVITNRVNDGAVVLQKPESNEKIESPLTVSGKAKGPWFFEGNFEILLVDNSKRVLTRSYVSARGDWMQEDYVPFRGTITFDPPDSIKEGFLILRAANPSGRPELAKQKKIPIRFRISPRE